MRKQKAFPLSELLIVPAIILICAAFQSAYAQQIELANVPATLASGQCSSPVYVKLYEGNRVIKASSTIQVSLASSGASGVTFFSKSDCTKLISSVAIAENATQIKFFFSSSQAGTATISASAQGSGLNVASASVTIDGSSAGLGVEESEMVRIINRVRSDAGLAQLQASASLTNAALWMANDMASNAWTSAQMQNSNNNYDADTEGRNLWQRISAFGYFGGTEPYNGEMLIAGQPDALSTFYEPNVVYELNTAFTVPYATVIGVAHVYAAPLGWYWVIDFGGTNVDQTLSLNAPPTPNEQTQTACSAWDSAYHPLGRRTGPATSPVAAPEPSTPGSTQGTLSLVNYYRNLAGLPAVADDSTWNQEAQACALVEAANFNTYGLSHSPQPSWECYSGFGATGAAQSNLASLNAQSAILFSWKILGLHLSGIAVGFSPISSLRSAGSTTTTSCLKVVGGIQYQILNRGSLGHLPE